MQLAVAPMTLNIGEIVQAASLWPRAIYRVELCVEDRPPELLPVDALRREKDHVNIAGRSPEACFSSRVSGNPGGQSFDDVVTLSFPFEARRVTTFNAGLVFAAQSLGHFTLHPVPFKVGLDGKARSRPVSDLAPTEDYAEGWILEDGTRGLLVVRVPDGNPNTCFVPMVVRGDSDEVSLQIGSVGPDGGDHRVRSPFLDACQPGQTVEFPATRYIFYEGGWEEGLRLFRQTVADAVSPFRDSYRSMPVTYNTFHDFGPTYTKDRLAEVMPRLQDLGVGLIHLDPGWETEWGSTEWNDATMGTPEEFTALSRQHGLSAGCWTSLHTIKPDVHEGHYALDTHGQKYIAEDFGETRLVGVCPLSGWRETFQRNMERLVRAGFVFVNSDFHDWPWSGESCHDASHGHPHPPDRMEWALAVNDAFAGLHAVNERLVVEMHDHVESGEYRTPVWYLYARPHSYNEKWAYEFMWTTYQDLMDRKLFALYHLRKAEPIPLFLHINMTSDNANAIAFWYVASCVNHIGIGGVTKAPEQVYAGYKKAIATYNRYLEELTVGEFIGLDELTHAHIHPKGKGAVLLCFNLGAQAATRDVCLDSWASLKDMKPGSECADVDVKTVEGRRIISVRIASEGVTVVPLQAPD